MKIEVDSTFQEFSTELKEKVSEIKKDPYFTTKDIQEVLRARRKNAYTIAANTFPDDIKVLLERHDLIAKYGELTKKLSLRLQEEKITYNTYPDWGVIQIFINGETHHQYLVDAEILAKEYFQIFPENQHYDLLVGFCEEPRVNEVLQLMFYLVAGPQEY